jgi:hypothetical protein
MRALAGTLWDCLKALARAWAAGHSRERRQLSVSATLALGPRKTLLVVAYRRRRFLVAQGAEGVSAMLEIGIDGHAGAGRRGSGFTRRRRLPVARGGRRLATAEIRGLSAWSAQ